MAKKNESKEEILDRFYKLIDQKPSPDASFFERLVLARKIASIKLIEDCVPGREPELRIVRVDEVTGGYRDVVNE